jgi:hypothetical protein
MLKYRKRRPSFFDRKDEGSQNEKKDSDSQSEESKEERIERIKFRSLRKKRRMGDRSLGWLFFLLIIVGALFWYLSQ